MAPSKQTNKNTKDIKILILVGALAATIAGWAGLASQNNHTSAAASTQPAVEVMSTQTTLEQPVVRRVAPAPVTTTRSSR